MNKIYFLLLFCYEIPAWGQDNDAYKILESVKNRYDKIIDFTARAEILVDLDLVKVPNKYVSVRFKAPDKYYFNCEGFVMLPKRGLNFSIAALLCQPYTAIFEGEMSAEGRTLYQIKVIPKGSNEEIVLVTLWIDSISLFIQKVESITKRSGFYELTFHYDQKEIPLPDWVIISFEVDNLHFPLKFLGEIKIDEHEKTIPKQANITIRYTNYLVNIGLKEEDFPKIDNE